jgi:hypothetical protein
MSSEYCERSNIEDWVGVDNVAHFADINNSESAAEIAARIVRAIDVASEQVDDALRRSPYTIPLTSPAGSTPLVIVDITAKLAGAWLYEPRGHENFQGQTVNALATVKETALKELNNIATGKKRIDAL